MERVALLGCFAVDILSWLEMEMILESFNPEPLILELEHTRYCTCLSCRYLGLPSRYCRRRRRSLKPKGIMQAQRAMYILYYSLQLTDAFKHVC